MADGNVTTVQAQAAAARSASRKLALLSGEIKNKALSAMAEAIEANKKEIIFHNEIDIQAAREAGLSAAMVDRLTLNEKRILDMAQGLRQIAALKDPVGEITEQWTPPAGINIQRVRVPLGVIGMIYESRPNVTVEAAGLCLKGMDIVEKAVNHERN